MIKQKIPINFMQPDGKSKSFITDLTAGSVPKLLVRFAAPLFMANLLQIVYNMVDMVVVGHAVGDAGLSGVSIGGEILNFITHLLMGCSNAAQVMIPSLSAEEKRGRSAGS